MASGKCWMGLAFHQVSYPDVYSSSWFPAWPCCSCFCKPKRLMWCIGSYFLCVQSYPTLQSLHDVSELGECRPWMAETGMTHSPLSCFWQSHDNNLVVTLLVCVLWTGLLVMAWAGGADLYWFEKPLCLNISALGLYSVSVRELSLKSTREHFWPHLLAMSCTSAGVRSFPLTLSPLWTYSGLFWSQIAVSTCFISVYIAVQAKHLYFRLWS